MNQLLMIKFSENFFQKSIDPQNNFFKEIFKKFSKKDFFPKKYFSKENFQK